MIEVEFLGTGTSQGVPIITCDCPVCQSPNPKDKRLRSSIFINYNGLKLVIDSGPDFRQQMIRANIKELDALLFTHEHKDHTAGFDDIRAYNYKLKKALPVYCNNSVLETLKRDFYYVFEEFKYPGVPEADIHLINNNEFEIKGRKILPIKVMHYKLPVFGFRFQDFVYITDANFIASQEKEKIKGAKILVLNALRLETHISHFSLSEAIELAKELNVPQVYFTHISHQLGFHEEVEKSLPNNIHLAYDGLKISLN